MKKFITALFCSVIGGTALAQWTPTTFNRSATIKPSSVQQHFKLDLNALRSQLSNAQETGPSAKPVYISLPNLRGKIEKFAVYSFPVMVKELADQYQLGSYVGVGVDNPGKYLRFSISPNDFSSMIINNGEYEFIDAQNTEKTVYGVHAKGSKEGKSFVCSTSESPLAVRQLDELQKAGQVFTNQPTDFSKSSDKKYRTMRLAIAATGEYTTYHGGTQALALAAINTTITRVNGVFEKDLALHLNIQNFPNIIFTNAATDFYTPPSNPPLPTDTSINYQLQQLLSSSAVGEANYDIGHVFNAAGNNGSAGCIGCVCLSPTSTNPNDLQTAYRKGSAFTQSVNPIGDAFDIDFVAHEMGHQLGGTHTYSHTLENAFTNVEPGSGSTIMGYAGITGANTDVQPNSDPFFHKVSILQIQNNLTIKNCDVETTVANNPPVITSLPTYNIPKGTAFALTAAATDPESDPLTYMWEQVDNATVSINRNNIGSTTTGASFRSLVPSTSPTRYFPKLASVLNGVLDNANNEWESVSKVARTTKFAVTVRDNHPIATQQQTNFAEQTIVVGNEGPFKVTTTYANVALPSAVNWDVAGTVAAPYNVANVKIDYTIDNGTNWTVVAASTPNDGIESLTFPTSLNGQTIKLRVSSIGNVFYAVGSIIVTQYSPCDGTAPSGVLVSNITTSSANITWTPVVGATYIVRYKRTVDAAWITLPVNSNTVSLPSLLDNTAYEVQVAAVCSGTQGSYSSSANFTTSVLPTYCGVASGFSTDDYISNVSIANVNNPSGASAYTSFVTNPALQVNLTAGNPYTLSVTRAWLISPGSYPAATSAWIDFNRNGVFEDSERVMTQAASASNPATVTFTVPTNSVLGLGLRMRVGMLFTAPNQFIVGACGLYTGLYGEFEDYNVIITGALSTNEISLNNSGIQIYPNPVTDILNVTKVSDKAAFKIYSAAGQLVSSGNVTDGKINVTSLIKGAYVISVTDKGREAFNSKFIKK